MKQSIAALQNNRIAYTDTGSGPAVVLLHGFCGSGAYWDEVAPKLAEEVRVIVPDLRGHGHSSAPEGEYGMEAFAEDIAELLTSLGINKAVLLGHSLGGYATLAFAERFPDKLQGFGLIHSTGFPDTEQGKEGRTKNMSLVREQGIEKLLEGLVPKLFAPEHVVSMPEAIAKARAIGLETDAEGAIRTLAGMRDRPDRNAVLTSAKVPVLLVAGEKDQIISPDKTFLPENPLLRKELLAGAGHMSMMEAPDKLTQTLLAFLRQFK